MPHLPRENQLQFSIQSGTVIRAGLTFSWALGTFIIFAKPKKLRGSIPFILCFVGPFFIVNPKPGLPYA